TVDFDVAHAAEQSFFEDEIACLDEVWRTAPLGADLHDALVAPGSGHHRLTFHDVHADGFLHPHIGPGLQGGDGGQRVPVIGGIHQHNVEILVAEHLAIVAVGAGPAFGPLAHGYHVGGFREHAAVHVA